MDWVPLAGGGADLSQQIVVLGERRLRLTTKERDLLAYLAQHPGRTITRGELLTAVWRNPAHGSEEPVYSTIKRLRAKIDRGPHRHIVSVHGDGYRWAPVGAAAQHATSPARVDTGPRFFGRAAELRAIRDAFDQGARLVTLVGPGGAGKTRCAREALAVTPHVFCDLASATTEEAVLSTVAAAFDVPLDGEAPAAWARGVGRALRAADGSRVVVLDNAEQVLAVVAALVLGWLDAGPPLLVTSREPLRLEREVVVEIGSLSGADAVGLYADRVTVAGGDPGDPQLQARIVDRVDRLALSVELAAAQARELGAAALFESLDVQLETLVAGARDAPARHATLRAAVAWSYALLEPREREVLADLAVFVGPFDLEAARATSSRRTTRPPSSRRSVVDPTCGARAIASRCTRRSASSRASATGRVTAPSRATPRTPPTQASAPSRGSTRGVPRCRSARAGRSDGRAPRRVRVGLRT